MIERLNAVQRLHYAFALLDADRTEEAEPLFTAAKLDDTKKSLIANRVDQKCRAAIVNLRENLSADDLAVITDRMYALIALCTACAVTRPGIFPDMVYKLLVLKYYQSAYDLAKVIGNTMLQHSVVCECLKIGCLPLAIELAEDMKIELPEEEMQTCMKICWTHKQHLLLAFQKGKAGYVQFRSAMLYYFEQGRLCEGYKFMDAGKVQVSGEELMSAADAVCTRLTKEPNVHIAGEEKAGMFALNIYVQAQAWGRILGWANDLVKADRDEEAMALYVLVPNETKFTHW
jgi:hypothetical protein